MQPGEMDVGLSDAGRRRFWGRYWLLIGLGAAVLFLLFAVAFAAGVFDKTDQSAPPPRIRVEHPARRPASPPPAPRLDAQGRSVTNVDWRERPAPDYPSKAQQAGVDAGSATLSCITSPQGRLSACEIVTEDPPGMGFGDAAAKAALRARVYPTTVDGAPQGGRMRFTVRFRLQ